MSMMIRIQDSHSVKDVRFDTFMDKNVPTSQPSVGIYSPTSELNLENHHVRNSVLLPEHYVESHDAPHDSVICPKLVAKSK